MIGPSDVRIGDAERDAAAASLGEHFAVGRLTFDEFRQRIDQVFAARTGRDLAAVVHDLPQGSPPQGSAPGPAFRPARSGAPGAAGRAREGRGARSRHAGHVRRRVCALACLALLVPALFVITGLFRPFSFGLLPRPALVLLVLAVVFGRRLARLVLGGRPPRRRGRRW